jgi:hypothetical protein
MTLTISRYQRLVIDGAATRAPGRAGAVLRELLR